MKLLTLFNSIQVDGDLIEIEKTGLSKVLGLGSFSGWCVIPLTSLGCVEFENKWFGTRLKLTIQKVSYDRDMEILVMKKLTVSLPGLFASKRNKLKKIILLINDRMVNNRAYHQACMNVMKSKNHKQQEISVANTNWNVTLS